MYKRALLESVTITAAAAVGAGAAAGLVHLAQGGRAGAPGLTSALSRIGRRAGGGMMTGIALAAGSGTLAGLALYQGLKGFGRRLS